jgi:methionyl-tRNA formyltransferase
MKKLGIIGERKNKITEVLNCEGIEVSWFVDSKIKNNLRSKLYGNSLKINIIFRMLFNILKLLTKRKRIDCKRICLKNKIKYFIPKNNSINNGLPNHLYSNPEVDYVLICGCDQLLNENGLKLARKKIINYHYSPLPAYRGKFVVFWQWFNEEPFVGYSFHEVDLGVDTGNVLYQDKIYFDKNISLKEITEKVIKESSKKICDVFSAINEQKIYIIDDKLVSSFYPSKKYHDLITITPNKSLDELFNVFKKLNFLKLKCGIVVNDVQKVYSESFIQDIKGQYLYKNGYLLLKIRDGWVKVRVKSKLKWLFYLLSNRKDMIYGFK